MERRNFIKLSTLSSLAISPIKETLEMGFSLNKEAEKDIEKGLIFLFQGDSITDGNRGRNNDLNHIMGHGYAYAVASRVGADFADSAFTFYNRGISGNKITDLEKRWQTDSLDLKPDVLSILVGINDTNAVARQSGNTTTIEQFESIYRDLITKNRLLNPKMLLVLGLPFAFRGTRTDANWAVVVEDLRGRQGVVRKLATEFNAVLVDYPALFDKLIKKPSLTYWIWDGVHPTVFGHEMMARLWIKEVSKRLKFLKKY